MIEDLLKNIKSALYDRVSSPLSRTFIISWLIIHWRIPLIISDANLAAAEKINTIDGLINWTDSFVIPLGSATVYIALVPFFSYVAYLVALWHQNNLINLKWKFELKKPISMKDSIDLKQRVHDLEHGYSKAGENYEASIKQLETENSELRNQVNLLNSDDRLLGAKNTPEQILVKIKEKKLTGSFELIARESLTDVLYISQSNIPQQHLADLRTLAVIDFEGNQILLTPLGKQVYSSLRGF